MEVSEFSRRGGSSSRKDIGKKKARLIGQKAAQSSWQGHASALPDCGCPHCIARKTKSK